MLRDYQKKAVEDLRHWFRSGKLAPLFVLPTGGGKTFVFCFIAQQITGRGKRACILVHRQELLNQGSRSLEALGVEHGIIAPGFREDRRAIQVASVQTLVSRLKKLTNEEAARIYSFDLLIIDEAHHAVAGSWGKVIERLRQINPNLRILGVTATPCRSDGRGLADVFDAMVVGPSIGQLIDEGHLVRPVVFAPPARIDLAKLHVRGGDYNAKEAAAEMDKPTITGDAVAHYARLSPFKPAVAFCVSVEHAEHVAAQFRAAGFSSTHLDGSASDAERRGKIAGLASGEIHVLTSCDLISEGTDIPVIETAILLRPTMSTGLYLQQVGRALRPSPGKTRALILDHVGNCLMHGMPDDEREWSLEGIERKKRGNQDLNKLRLRQCTQCYAFHEHAPECPECGHVYDTAQSSPQHVEGELRELTEAEKQQIREQAERMRKQARQEQGTAQTLDELIALGKKRGYKNPKFWAQHVLKSRGR